MFILRFPPQVSAELPAQAMLQPEDAGAPPFSILLSQTASEEGG
jgi:hypothetical protein